LKKWALIIIICIFLGTIPTACVGNKNQNGYEPQIPMIAPTTEPKTTDKLEPYTKNEIDNRKPDVVGACIGEISFDYFDLSACPGVGPVLIFEDEYFIIFFDEIGLFGYDLNENELVFAIDFMKAIGRPGRVQGSHGTVATVSYDGKIITFMDTGADNPLDDVYFYIIDITSLTFTRTLMQVDNAINFRPIDNLTTFSLDNAIGFVQTSNEMRHTRYRRKDVIWYIFNSWVEFGEGVVRLSQMQRVNIAELMGRDWDDVQCLLGNDIGNGKGYSKRGNEWVFLGREALFDTGITIRTSTSDGEYNEWLDIVSIQFREPENLGIASFYSNPGFYSYALSKRFHFNGLGYKSTHADVATIFSHEYFSSAYVRDLSIFDGEVEVAIPVNEKWLLSRRNSLLYWNNRYAIVFDFSKNGKIIGFIAFSNRAECVAYQRIVGRQSRPTMR